MSKFAKSLALLTVHENNCRVLHWNAIGCHFENIHATASKFYEEFGSMLDTVTEMATICGERPVNTIAAIKILEECKHQHVIVNPEKDFEHKDLHENLAAISKEIYTELCNLQTELTPDMKSQLDPMLEWIRIEGFYKLGQLLKEV